MAIPRIFVSSTCYDLQEIRFQLRGFIQEFGYDVAMSEFDDIFYSYDTHVQDSCLEEISKCQLFLLIVGNNYGSHYHQDKLDSPIPDSVTLKEFRKAIEARIPKYIFINKFVDYDFNNYKRALNRILTKYFSENDVTDDKINETKKNIKKDFDLKYHFPFDSYKYIFHFLEIIYELKENNARYQFEAFNDIKESLRKQWSGLIYEALVKKENRSSALMLPLENKLEKIENLLNRLLESKVSSMDDNVTFDLKILDKEKKNEIFENLKDRISNLMTDILYATDYDSWGMERHIGRQQLSEKITSEMAKAWLDSLTYIKKTYKWSKSIDTSIIFKGFPIYRIDQIYSEVDFSTISELESIYTKMSPDEKETLSNTVCQEINRVVMKNMSIDPDNLPF